MARRLLSGDHARRGARTRRVRRKTKNEEATRGVFLFLNSEFFQQQHFTNTFWYQNKFNFYENFCGAWIR